MNKLKFVEFIRQPGNLTSKNIDEIGQVIEKYPYFQNARIILAKGNKTKELPETNKRVSSAAIYATNRVLLKKYLNDELIFLRSLDVHESVDNSTINKQPELGKNKQEPILSKPTLEESEIKEIKAAELEKDKDADRDSTSNSIEIEKNENTEVTPTIETNENEHSSLDDLISDIWKDIDELRKSKARFQEIEKRIEEDEAVDSALKKATQKASSKTVIKTTAKKPTPTKKNTPARTTTVKKTAAKKTTVPKITKPVAKKPATTVKKPATKRSTKTNTPKSEGTQESGKKDDKGDPKTFQNELIEKFIKASPAMPSMTKRQNPDKIEDLSRDSTELNEEIASEYLAEIFLEQGKKERAIEIYQTLSLKFPEKKSYFASLIKKIK